MNHWDEATTAIERAFNKPSHHKAEYNSIDGTTIQNGQYHRRLNSFGAILKSKGIFIRTDTVKKGKQKKLQILMMTN